MELLLQLTLLAAVINPIADVEVVNNWDLGAKHYNPVSRRCPQLVLHFKSSRGPSQDKIWISNF